MLEAEVVEPDVIVVGGFLEVLFGRRREGKGKGERVSKVGHNRVFNIEYGIKSIISSSYYYYYYYYY